MLIIQDLLEVGRSEQKKNNKKVVCIGRVGNFEYLKVDKQIAIKKYIIKLQQCYLLSITSVTSLLYKVNNLLKKQKLDDIRVGQNHFPYKNGKRVSAEFYKSKIMIFERKILQKIYMAQRVTEEGNYDK